MRESCRPGDATRELFKVEKELLDLKSARSQGACASLSGGGGRMMLCPDHGSEQNESRSGKVTSRCVAVRARRLPTVIRETRMDPVIVGFGRQEDNGLLGCERGSPARSLLGFGAQWVSMMTRDCRIPVTSLGRRSVLVVYPKDERGGGRRVI
jgi:hypothetical protein